MSKKKALGRGLAAILNDSQKEFEEHKQPNALKESNSIHEIDIESIAINPFQPRTNFEKKELQKENEQLKAAVQELEHKVQRLKAKISDIQKATTFFGRGLPWR